MNLRLSRVAIAVAVVVAIVLLAGVTYQGVATALERRDFPPPGARVDVGGHQLHIHCTGEGSPAVVLEAPATGMSAVWAWVQPEVARHTRVCSYNRAGLGWSEAGDRPFNPGTVPTQLHALLEGAHIPRPYVLVGESLGSVFARLYAARYPSEVPGMVLVDDPTPSEGGVHGQATSHAFGRFIQYSPWLARTGLLRATRALSREAQGLPSPAAGAVRAFLNRPDHLTRAGRELARWHEAIALATQAQLPVSVIVREVESDANQPGAFLTTAKEAAKVTTAILRLVQEMRR